MIDQDEPAANGPEDVGYTREALSRGPHPPLPRRTTMAAKTEETTTREEGPRGFGPLLAQIQDGELEIELAGETKSLIADLWNYSNKFQRDAKGNLTLSLNFTVHGNGSISVMGEVKVKKPKTPRAPSTFFRTPGNNLTLENPRQQKLPLREVPTSKQERREVNPERETRTV